MITLADMDSVCTNEEADFQGFWNFLKGGRYPGTVDICCFGNVCNFEFT